MNKIVCAYPAKWLRTVSVPVLSFDDELKALVEDLKDTVRIANGMGISAIQINVAARVFVVTAKIANTEHPVVFVNPEVLETKGERLIAEGCLSLPACWVRCKRAEEVRITAFDIEGKPFEVTADASYAQVIQHEMEHLNGKLIVDHALTVKRELIERRFKKRVGLFVDYERQAWVK